MPCVKWSDEYSTGIPDIDREHRGLFALINDLYDKVEAGSAETSVKATIEALVDYVNYHFDKEEILMTACKYADLDNHVAGHRRLQNQLQAYERSYSQDPEKFDMADFMSFLIYWLKVHILEADMAYVPHVQRHAGHAIKE